MATGTAITLDEYLSTIYEPDCEYVDGELIERNMGEFDHSVFQMIISGQLFSQRREYGIFVYPELRVQVSATRCRIPGITVTTTRGHGKILREPPFLCIEILSPEDRASRVEDKIDDYLAFGVRYVWVIDPLRRKAWNYSSEGKRESSAVLSTANPHLTLALADVFAAADDELNR